jgi:hypothetical protein
MADETIGSPPAHERMGVAWLELQRALKAVRTHAEAALGLAVPRLLAGPLAFVEPLWLGVPAVAMALCLRRWWSCPWTRR